MHTQDESINLKNEVLRFYNYYLNVSINVTLNYIHMSLTTITHETTIIPILQVDKSFVDKNITVQGWVNSIRRGKNTGFIDLIDSPNTNESILQCVIPKELLETFGTVFHKSFICMSGTISLLPAKAKTIKGIEFKITALLHNSNSKSDYDSIAPEGSYNHNNHTLYLRHKHRRNFILLTDLVLRALNETAHTLGMIKITPPLYGSVKCEGGSELYETDHFGTKAYLTQSSQMYLEAALPAVLMGTYCDSPSFRKEKSRTKRHLTQFTHWECEVFGIYTLDMFLDFLKKFINTFFTQLFALDNLHIIESLNRTDFIKNIINKEIKILEHSSAIELLNTSGITKTDGTQFGPYDDIPEAQERKLIDTIGSIVFLTKFPTMTKAFYTATDPTDKTRALAVDVEFPLVGEIFGCSLRESSSSVLRKKLELFTLRDVSDEILDVVIIDDEIIKKFSCDTKDNYKTKVATLIHEQDNQKLKEVLFELIQILSSSDANSVLVSKFLDSIKNIPYNEYKWYFDLRDYGFSMTGGFGLGVERLVTWLSGGEIIENEHNYSIHSVTTFPRTVDKLTP